MTFDCPECGEENEIDEEDESAVCDECDAILLIDVDEEGKVHVSIG